MKALIASLLLYGVASPFCLCGEALSESHLAFPEAGQCVPEGYDHDHGHRHDHREPGPASDEESDHSHESHSGFRQIVVGTVSVPAVKVVDLSESFLFIDPATLGGIRFETGTVVTVSWWPGSDGRPPGTSPCPVLTGVFRL